MSKCEQNPTLAQGNPKKETYTPLDKIIQNARTRAGAFKRKRAYSGPRGKYLTK